MTYQNRIISDEAKAKLETARHQKVFRESKERKITRGQLEDGKTQTNKQ